VSNTVWRKKGPEGGKGGTCREGESFTRSPRKARSIKKKEARGHQRKRAYRENSLYHARRKKDKIGNGAYTREYLSQKEARRGEKRRNQGGRESGGPFRLAPRMWKKGADGFENGRIRYLLSKRGIWSSEDNLVQGVPRGRPGKRRGFVKKKKGRSLKSDARIGARNRKEGPKREKATEKRGSSF